MDTVKIRWERLVFLAQITLASAEAGRDYTLAELRQFQSFPEITVSPEIIRAHAKRWALTQYWPFHRATESHPVMYVQLLFRLAHETIHLVEDVKRVLVRLEQGGNSSTKSIPKLTKIRDSLKLIAIREWNRGICAQAYLSGGMTPYSQIDPNTIDSFCTWTSTPDLARANFPLYGHACSLVDLFDSILASTLIANDGK